MGQALTIKEIEKNEQFTNDLGAILIRLLQVEQGEMVWLTFIDFFIIFFQAKTLIQSLLCAENCPNIRLKKVDFILNFLKFFSGPKAIGLACRGCCQ